MTNVRPLHPCQNAERCTREVLPGSHFCEEHVSKGELVALVRRLSRGRPEREPEPEKTFPQESPTRPDFPMPPDRGTA